MNSSSIKYRLIFSLLVKGSSRVWSSRHVMPLLVSICLLTTPLTVHSQGGIYPVQVNTVIQPPFTLNFHDYTLPGKFFSQIFLADRNRDNLEVYLKLTIKGPNNINIFTTNPQAHPAVTLTGGSITTVTSDEYGYLFSTNNLTFSGIAPEAPLPEGFYIFNLEVIEKNTGILVSNAFVGGYSTMIVRSDPPFLNTPINQKNIEMTNPQPVIAFQWTPRHVSLNTVNNITYNLRVVRISTPGMHPNQAMNGGAPTVLDIETTGTSFAWDMNNPQIINDPLANFTAGATVDNSFSGSEGVFAWQVRAIDPNNTDVFKNQGYSEVYSFSYSQPCDLPIVQSVELQEDNSIKVNLMANESHQLYEVYVKELGARSFAQKVTSEMSPIIVSNLDPSITYEVQARAQCGVAWTNKAYLGTVTTSGSAGNGCVAPTTILSEVEEDTLVTFKWDNASLSGEYRLFLQLEGEELQELLVQDTVYTTTVLVDNYPLELSVDAVCGDKYGLGTSVIINQATSGYLGECSFPERNGFVPEVQGSSVSATWSKLSEHQSFDIRYRKQGDLSWIPEQTLETLSRPQTPLDSVEKGVQYEYQLKYNCAEGTTDWSDTRTFLLDLNSSTGTNAVNTSGSCMPPRAVLDELTGETSVEIKWDKVRGVRDYELLYRPLSVPTWTTVSVSGTKYELTNLLPTTPYIYQIRCVCQDGASVSSDELRFRTGDSLSYSKDCPKLELITATGISETQLTAGWEKESEHTSFILFYKEDKQSIGDWYQHLTPDPEHLLDHLKPNTTYNIKIQATCGTDKAKESETFDFTTLPSEDPREDFECGAESPDACDRTGAPLTGALQADDIIIAHDFEIKVLEGSGNPFNGKGQVVVPYMNNAQVLVDLVAVEVNEDLCMTGGKMITTGMHLQLFPDAFIDRVNGVLTAVDNTFSRVETTLDQAAGYLDQVDDIINTITEPIDLSAYDDLSPEEMFEEGKRLYNENKDKFDQYTSGNLDNIDVSQVLTDIKTGAALIKKAIEMGAGIIHQIDEYDNLDATSDYKVTFSPTSDNQNTFDAYNGSEFGKFYQQMGTAEEGVKYHVPYMAIDAGETKKVVATVTIADFDKTKLSFITNSIVGQDLQVIQPNTLSFTELSTGVFEVTVPADAKRVYALYKTTDGLNHRMAKLKVIETPALTQKVIIVPNSSSHRISAQNIQTALNQIYDVPNVTFSVEVRAPYTSQAWDTGEEGMQVDDHKFMSRYSNEMKDLKNAYFSQNTAQDTADAVYLFVVDKMVNTEGGNILGYMPRNKQVGFLAPNPSTTTTAHELGHGLFRLAHTWQLDNTQPEGSTKNLMDYDNGTTLLGAQWEQIHNPSFDIYGLDETEDAMAIIDGNVKSFLQRIKEARENNEHITLRSDIINNNLIWSDDNIELGERNYGEIKIVFESLSQNLTINPELYFKSTLTETEYWFFDKTWYSIVYKLNENEVVKILVNDYSKRAHLCEYLYGESDFMQKLQHIHDASENGEEVTLSYCNHCSYIDILEDVTIDGEEYSQIFVKFLEGFEKNSEVTIPTSNYRDTGHGFELYDEDEEAFFTINFYRSNLGQEEYQRKMNHLEEWLFGDGDNLVMRFFADGAIVQYVPLDIREDFDLQFNDVTYEGRVFEVTYEYIDGNDTTDLGTYEYFMTANQYPGEALYGATSLIDLIDFRDVEQDGFNITWNSALERYYMNLRTFGSLLLALRESGHDDFTFNGFSNVQGLSVGGSTSHKNGFNGDLRYLRTDASGGSLNIYGTGWQQLDIDRQNDFNDDLYDERWYSMLSQTYNVNQILNHCTNDSRGNHYDHLHIQGYDRNYTITYEEEDEE